MNKSFFAMLLAGFLSSAHATQYFTLTLINSTDDQYFCYDFDSIVDTMWSNQGELNGKGCIVPQETKIISEISDTVYFIADTLEIPLYIPKKTEYGTQYTDEDKFYRIWLRLANTWSGEYVSISDVNFNPNTDGNTKTYDSEGDSNDQHRIKLQLYSEKLEVYNNESYLGERIPPD